MIYLEIFISVASIINFITSIFIFKKLKSVIRHISEERLPENNDANVQSILHSRLLEMQNRRYAIRQIQR